MTMDTFNFVNKVNIHSVTLKLGLDDFFHIFYKYLNINKINIDSKCFIMTV